jgi:two-component system cell cycle response regulator
LSRIERQGTPVTFLMIDVDKFKTVNTRFGHLMGDRILAEVAQVLRKTFRAADTIIRYGGDEFLVMLDGCDENQASLAVSRLQQEVVEWNRQKLVPAYEMKLSCGIGRYTKGARIAEVLDIADRAMYAAKTGTVAPDSTVTNLPRQ